MLRQAGTKIKRPAFQISVGISAIGFQGDARHDLSAWIAMRIVQLDHPVMGCHPTNWLLGKGLQPIHLPCPGRSRKGLQHPGPRKDNHQSHRLFEADATYLFPGSHAATFYGNTGSIADDEPVNPMNGSRSAACPFRADGIQTLVSRKTGCGAVINAVSQYESSPST